MSLTIFTFVVSLPREICLDFNQCKQIAASYNLEIVKFVARTPTEIILQGQDRAGFEMFKKCLFNEVAIFELYFSQTELLHRLQEAGSLHILAADLFENEADANTFVHGFTNAVEGLITNGGRLKVQSSPYYIGACLGHRFVTLFAHRLVAK